jgi:hypothetical protein
MMIEECNPMRTLFFLLPVLALAACDTASEPKQFNLANFDGSTGSRIRSPLAENPTAVLSEPRGALEYIQQHSLTFNMP